MKRVRKAVFPVAGLGALPSSGEVSQCRLCLGSTRPHGAMPAMIRKMLGEARPAIRQRAG